MGTKHRPLPSDPDAKAAEKKRRFKIYRREWQRRKRQELRAQKIRQAFDRRDLELAARRAGIDLCVDLRDLSSKQLRSIIERVRSDHGLQDTLA
jgi:hypothetical protein